MLPEQLLTRKIRSALDEDEPGDPGPGELEILVSSLERAANHHLLPMTCLCRSLALKKMLSRRGIQARLSMGAQKTATGIEAHAWLSLTARNPEPDCNYVSVAKRHRDIDLAGQLDELRRPGEPVPVPEPEPGCKDRIGHLRRVPL